MTNILTSRIMSRSSNVQSTGTVWVGSEKMIFVFSACSPVSIKTTFKLKITLLYKLYMMLNLKTEKMFCITFNENQSSVKHQKNHISSIIYYR